MYDSSREEGQALGRCGSFERYEAFIMSVACFACDWAQKSMSVHEEESPCDFKQGCKAAVYSALFFKHGRDTVWSSVPSQTSSSCTALHHLNPIFTVVFNSWARIPDT